MTDAEIRRLKNVELSICRIEQADANDETFNEFVMCNDAAKVVAYLKNLHQRSVDLVKSLDNWKNVNPVNYQVQQDVERLREMLALVRL